MKKLHHHGVNVNAVDKRTFAMRYGHYDTACWLSTTQVWSWKGGDAIVVMTGSIGAAQAYVVIRQGDKVQVLPADGLSRAMEAVGLNPKEFQIQVGGN